MPIHLHFIKEYNKRTSDFLGLKKEELGVFIILLEFSNNPFNSLSYLNCIKCDGRQILTVLKNL